MNPRDTTARHCVPLLVRGADRTYDSIHSLLISSEDDDPAVFPHGDDLWTAAHNTSTGSVVARVIVSSGPLVAKRYCLKDKTIKRFQQSSMIVMGAVQTHDTNYSEQNRQLFLRLPDYFGDGGKW